MPSNIIKNEEYKERSRACASSYRNWVGVGIGVDLCDLVIYHWNFLPAIGTSVLYLGPMPQALRVENVLIRTQQYINLFIYIEVLEANGAASTSIDNVVHGCVFHWHIDVLETLVRVGFAAATDED